MIAVTTILGVLPVPDAAQRQVSRNGRAGGMFMSSSSPRFVIPVVYTCSMTCRQ
jgi:hypothetical protein